MKIGIIGFGQIGKTLASKLSAAGHQVKVASSRAPEAIAEEVRGLGGRAVAVADAVADVDVVILSLPLAGIVDVAPLVARASVDAVVIDTSNYYPFRDGAIAALDEGALEAVWVGEQIGRPVVKAWNAVLSHTLAHQGKLEGVDGRIAVPVSGDDAGAKAVACQLVNATGFDAVDAGSLDESWRQQPGNLAYCTDLDAEALRAALAAADRVRAPKRRDEIIKALIAREAAPSHNDVVATNRAMTA